eukprot:gnl/TRDRNA2_/TRDRNA2_177207_c10_seq2.p2 gnl/TRDRNA2_/TRDRNA2_177207_c10~~gnl/TRDRNA2_/TRDRNA2_177207_c10_seq2.p2  ORF type:complete len:154 (+),score=47.08 gnl/TRDRNA2_/TRDRNA2_177207_c10_seq2:116-577(+)
MVVLGNSNRLIKLDEIKERYPEIPTAVDNLVRQEHARVHAQLAQLDIEVTELEEIIATCFEKMDEEGQGVITRECFVKFVCAEDGDENPQDVDDNSRVPYQDAVTLFDTMSKGQDELTYDQFKDEITNGGLEVLRGNIDMRRCKLQRYRDYWF